MGVVDENIKGAIRAATGVSGNGPLGEIRPGGGLFAHTSPHMGRSMDRKARQSRLQRLAAEAMSRNQDAAEDSLMAGDRSANGPALRYVRGLSIEDHPILDPSDRSQDMSLGKRVYKSILLLPDMADYR